MKNRKRRIWEKDIGMKIPQKDANIDRFNELINKSIDIMQNKAESELNPQRCHLSNGAKKRLKWMYIIQFECDNNISQTAKKIRVSRQWLSKIHSTWEKSDRDPRSLETESRAPNNTDNQKRISSEIKDKIVEARTQYHWGQDKLITVLDTKYKISVGASTIFSLIILAIFDSEYIGNEYLLQNTSKSFLILVLPILGQTSILSLLISFSISG